MMRMLRKSKLCHVALVAMMTVAVAQSEATAWTYGSWGSSIGYGGYGVLVPGWGYAGYGVGLFPRIRARRAARLAAWSCCSPYTTYGCCCSGCAVVSYPICCVPDPCAGVIYSTPVDCCSSVEYGTPVEVHSHGTPAEAPSEPTPIQPEPAPAEDSAAINITLPADAIVFVNDALTKSTGSSRSYVSQGLKQGRTYSYRLRVEYELNGKVVVENKTVSLTPGDNVQLSFGNEGQQQVASTEEPVQTALNVEVPENARVFLAGVPTKQTGEQRSFVTQRLAAGEQWDGYAVRVEWEQDGQTLVQERTLKIEGGQTYELAFDFNDQDAVKIARLGQ